MSVSNMKAILELLRIRPRTEGDRPQGSVPDPFDEFCPRCGMGHEGQCYETPKQRQQQKATEYQAMTCASGPGYWEDDDS